MICRIVVQSKVLEIYDFQDVAQKFEIRKMIKRLGKTFHILGVLSFIFNYQMIHLNTSITKKINICYLNK